jgi:cytochrome c553
MRRHVSSLVSIVSAIAFAALAAVGAATGAAAQDVADGARIWANKAGCPQCHGWAGDGHISGFHSPGGLPLRKTELTRDQIREVIQCGRPGTPMPHFDRFAYTDKRCYDMNAEDLGNLEAIRADITLQPFEIDAVADYVATKIKGAGPVTRAECTEYFGQTGAECDKYPEQPEAQQK